MLFKTKQFIRLGLVAFVTGFCLLTYELVASRLLAPYIGSSIYVWTSVIGVIILALSFGYVFGGWLADRRVKAADVSLLLLASSACAAVTLLSYSAVLETITSLLSDPRLQGLFASFILFAPTSFVLGSVSPYLARLSIRSIKTTGRVVAALEGTNAIGGIIGTLMTGFVLLGYFGSNQILIVLIVILIAMSWVVDSRHLALERIIITLGIIGLVVFANSLRLSGDIIANIDTPSSNYIVKEVSYPPGAERPTRILVTGPGAWQSGALTSGASDLVFWYTQKIADIIDQAPKKKDILILGGGAFSMPRYFAEKYPRSSITVVEIDPELPKIASEYFFYDNPPNVEIINDDARTFLEKNEKKFDVVVVDAFSDTSVPFSMTSLEYAQTLDKATRSESVVAVNLIASSTGACQELLAGINNSYSSVFSHRAHFNRSGNASDLRQNIIAAYSKKPLGWLNQSAAIPIHETKKTVFTDNFSPTDRLNFQCQQQDV